VALLEGTGLRGTSTVIAVREEIGETTEYHLVVRFHTISGSTVEFEEDISTPYSVGSHVPVLYLRWSPSTAMVNAQVIAPLLAPLFIVLVLGSVVASMLCGVVAEAARG
jgi:hypothetical protein